MKFIGTITQKRRSIARFATRRRPVDTMAFLHAKAANAFSTERCGTSCLTAVNPLGTAASIARIEHNVSIADSRSALELG